MPWLRPVNGPHPPRARLPSSRSGFGPDVAGIGRRLHWLFERYDAGVMPMRQGAGFKVRYPEVDGGQEGPAKVAKVAAEEATA